MGMRKYRDQPCSDLSYGQMKLVELAQILMLDPKLIMLDEPAGGINPTLIERIGEMIRELNSQGKTFLIVEHNMPFVLGLCNPVQVLARGDTIASGTPTRSRATRRSSTPTSARTSGSSNRWRRDPMLTMKGVFAGYGGGDVLQGVDLDVPAGSVCCIVGPNGAGKSTVLKAVSGLIQPRVGRDRAGGDLRLRPAPVAHPRDGRVAGAAGKRALPEHHGQGERAHGRVHPAPRPRLRARALRRRGGALPGREGARLGRGGATSRAASAGWSSSRAR